ncbi:Sorting and assembly machinery component 50-like protein [Sciurus carolinensis]|uniref:Sorting and assembly machinery component 50-like protein n=1 Tax=Sciurus carolinensis TaxID=30640 RepID=A0AA41MSP5_SCICA|nr:Sorting and assembly machinery component 50-like protein [Sciurus carolinensis]
MGTVHSRSLEPLPSNGPDIATLGVEAKFVEVEPEAKKEILENKDMIVQHVHFDCLGRTRDGIIMCEIGDAFKSRNLIEVMRMTQEACKKLLYLGIFRQVDILIDTSQGDNALPNGLDITFEVTISCDFYLSASLPADREQVADSYGKMKLSLVAAVILLLCVVWIKEEDKKEDVGMVVGIDLETTCSCIGMFKNGRM